MCRIAYIPNPGLLEYEDLEDLFSYLEKTIGGDGNGMAFASGGSIRVIKGVKLGTEVLARIASKITTPILFHTRRATLGGVCNALCQPFVENGTALVHNGMWRGWDGVGIEMIIQGLLNGNDPINDSRTAAALVANYGRYSLEAISSGVFVVMTPKGAWLHLRQGTFKWCEDMGVYASDFPKTDWPVVKSFGDDAIAYLGKNGPVFECGGWWSGKVFQYNMYQPGTLHSGVRIRDNKEHLEELP